MQAMKTLKIVVALLLLINIATLSFFWLNRPMHDGPPMHDGSPGHGGGPGNYLIHELNLDDKQQEQFRVMREHHHESMMNFREKAAEYRERINEQLKAAQPDSLRIRQLSDSIGYCQRDVELLTFYHFHDLRKICNPKQQQRFDEVIHDAIEMIVHGK